MCPFSEDQGRLGFRDVSEAEQRCENLRLTGFTVIRIGEKTYADFEIARRARQGQGAWSILGRLTSEIFYSSLGEISLNGMWFTPAPTPPGGATVGN